MSGSGVIEVNAYNPSTPFYTTFIYFHHLPTPQCKVKQMNIFGERSETASARANRALEL